MLLYYIHDAVKIKRYYRTSEFIAHQIASMIQNVSQNRESKAITIADMKNIVSAAYLSLYPGTTMFAQGKGHVYCHFPHPFIHCVKGNNDGTASCIWNLEVHTALNTSISPATTSCNVMNKTHHMSAVKYLQNVQPSNIHPKLKINPGEIKIVVETCILVRENDGYGDINGVFHSIKNMLGLYLVQPHVNGAETERNRAAFTSVVIFSPRPGLFSETAPK